MDDEWRGGGVGDKEGSSFYMYFFLFRCRGRKGGGGGTFTRTIQYINIKIKKIKKNPVLTGCNYVDSAARRPGRGGILLRCACAFRSRVMFCGVLTGVSFSEAIADGSAICVGDRLLATYA